MASPFRTMRFESSNAATAAAGRENSMAGVNQAPQILERHFLEVRCGLLDMAAALDRMERASGSDRARGDHAGRGAEEGAEAQREEGRDEKGPGHRRKGEGRAEDRRLQGDACQV